MWDKIKTLSWQPNGEAKIIYDEFIIKSDYSSQGLLEKLLICLIYEKQYANAVALSKSIINNYESSFHGFLFCGIASDMINDKDTAIWAYNEILNRNLISANAQPPVYSQLNIYGADKEFIEFLIDNSYTPQNIRNFVFREPFERIFHKERRLYTTPHFNVYYFPNSTAEKEIEMFCAKREEAYEKVAKFMQFDKNIKIDIYLYEDGSTKTSETGHTGTGWTYNKVIVEIYNQQQKLTPIHELVHIIAGLQYGYSVSAFREGLAVYVCNLFDPDITDDAVNSEYTSKVKQFHNDNQLFRLADLIKLQIGSVESIPHISYPQSAAFVDYSIRKLDKKSFFQLYSSLVDDYTDIGVKENVSKIETAYNKNIDDIENCWIGSII